MEQKGKYRYILRKKTAAIDLPGGHRLPEIESEVHLNHSIFITNPDLIPPSSTLWLEIEDKWTREIIYKWPKE